VERGQVQVQVQPCTPASEFSSSLVLQVSILPIGSWKTKNGGQHKIANFCAKDIGKVSDFARRRLKSMQRRPTLVRAFWKQAELAL
jgi:hypothetical protein